MQILYYKMIGNYLVGAFLKDKQIASCQYPQNTLLLPSSRLKTVSKSFLSISDSLKRLNKPARGSKIFI